MAIYSLQKVWRKKYQSILIRAFVIIKPDAYLQIGKIIDLILSKLNITKLKMTRLSLENAALFYDEHKGKLYY